MAFYQVLYWQNIPSQVKVWDDIDEVKFELSSKSISRIDKAAREQGLTSEDDYLSQWRWGEEHERNGSIQDVAAQLKNELEAALVSNNF